MQISITIQGGDLLMRKLEALPGRVAKKILGQALRDGAKIVQAEAKARAPVRTGLMRKSITVRAQKKKKRGEIGMNVMLDTKRHPGLISESAGGKRYFYPAVVEYGAEGRAARPFMRPAAQASKGRAEQAIRERLSEGILAAAKGPA